MVNQPLALAGTAIMHRLLQGIENEAGMRRGADAPADDAARTSNSRIAGHTRAAS